MNDLALYRRLLRQARPYWLHLAGLFGIGLLASPIALLNPVPLKIVVDSVLGSRPLPPLFRALVPASVAASAGALLAVAVGLLLAVAALGQLQGLANKFMQAYVGERLVLGLRTQLVQQAQRLSLSYHDTKGVADALYRIHQDASVIDKIMVEGIIPFITACFTLGTMIVATARLDWQLALVALAVSPPLVVLSRLYRPRLRREHRHIKKLETSALAVVQETLGALRVVKAFGGEQRQTDRFAERSREGVAARIRMSLMESRYGLLVGLTTALGTAAVLLIGVQHVQANLLTLGQLLMAVTYLGQLYDPLKTVSKKAATLQSYLASAERAFALLDLQPEVPERPDARALDRAHGAIEFRGVSFSYGPDRPVLHDVSFAIAPGTRLGIVGATGAGKTTLISLLTRFYDPVGGAILLDGIDLRDYKLADLRRQFAVVLQEPVLFSTSIAENIAYTAPGAPREQIIAAAQAANAHEFIERLPQGYDTEVGDRGVKLSGGQRQRISLARAFLRNSPVLILDEPTSSVDAHTEAAIVDALGRLQEGRTVITISHRPSAVARCDSLLTIEHGRVVGDTSRPGAARPRPAVLGFDRRREMLLAHPAVQAWSRLNPDRVIPDRITPAKFKANRPRNHLSVYRLEGVGPDGTAVIAKRAEPGAARVERTVYERILPHVSLPGPAFFGAVPEASPPDGRVEPASWLFIGEIQGDKYDPQRADHRVAAGRWLGMLNAEASSAPGLADLPDAGPARYREQMHTTRDLIRAAADNPAFGADDLAFLDRLLGQFEDLDERWDRLENASTGLAPTLIHGDFNGKNVRVHASSDGPQLLVFDWEDAGRGVPSIDLAQAVSPACRIAAMPDLATYAAIVGRRWPACTNLDVERLANCGSVFRALAVLAWDAQHLSRPWADGFLGNLEMYAAELAESLRRLGWTRATITRPRLAELEGRIR